MYRRIAEESLWTRVRPNSPAYHLHSSVYSAVRPTTVIATPVRATCTFAQPLKTNNNNGGSSLPKATYLPASATGKTRHGNYSEADCRKPSCSYNTLIGLALKASTTGNLPVNEIYAFIERLFPYFKTAPEGWKNCVRHSLSLGQYFRKVERTDGWHGKKGFHWEIIPDKRLSLETELEKFLTEGGRSVCQNYPSVAIDPTARVSHQLTSILPEQSGTPTKPSAVYIQSIHQGGTTSHSPTANFAQPQTLPQVRQQTSYLPNTMPPSTLNLTQLQTMPQVLQQYTEAQTAMLQTLYSQAMASTTPRHLLQTKPNTQQSAPPQLSSSAGHSHTLQIPARASSLLQAVVAPQLPPPTQEVTAASSRYTTNPNAYLEILNGTYPSNVHASPHIYNNCAVNGYVVSASYSPTRTAALNTRPPQLRTSYSSSVAPTSANWEPPNGNCRTLLPAPTQPAPSTSQSLDPGTATLRQVSSILGVRVTGEILETNGLLQSEMNRFQPSSEHYVSAHQESAVQMLEATHLRPSQSLVSSEIHSTPFSTSEITERLRKWTTSEATPEQEPNEVASEVSCDDGFSDTSHSLQANSPPKSQDSVEDDPYKELLKTLNMPTNTPLEAFADSLLNQPAACCNNKSSPKTTSVATSNGTATSPDPRKRPAEALENAGPSGKQRRLESAAAEALLSFRAAPRPTPPTLCLEGGGSKKEEESALPRCLTMNDNTLAAFHFQTRDLQFTSLFSVEDFQKLQETSE